MIEELKVQYDDGLCAAEGCTERGRPQVCLYDRRYHRHGAIHYENGHRLHPSLRFKTGVWRWMCDAHYAQIKDAFEAVDVR